MSNGHDCSSPSEGSSQGSTSEDSNTEPEDEEDLNYDMPSPQDFPRERISLGAEEPDLFEDRIEPKPPEDLGDGLDQGQPFASSSTAAERNAPTPAYKGKRE